MQKLILLLGLLSSGAIATAQKSALFIGNSYTYYNNLPAIVSAMARSTGDSLRYDSSAPGGYTFQGHSTYAPTLTKIAQGNWDFVVLQEQSQRPSFPQAQVESSVFPYARQLDSLVNLHNPCAETVFYTTWGRENGDADNCPFFAPLCTYEGMDSLLQLRYGQMADDNQAVEAPVAAVWRQLRGTTSIDLYDTDGSHPSLAGSYAAGATFYTVFFRKDPTFIGYDAGLGAVADTILATVKAIVFDDLARWRVGQYDTQADFSYSFANQFELNFVDNSAFADSLHWDFGDGSSATGSAASHIYPDSTATYTVQLIASHCGQSDTTTQQINITATPTGLQSATNSTPTAYQFNNIIYLRQAYQTNQIYMIFNSLGQATAQGNLQAGQTEIHLPSLPQGQYWLRLPQHIIPIHNH